MLPINKITNIYSFNYYRTVNNNLPNDCSHQDFLNIKETITTWRFDEEGNIIYYTIDKKTGEILSKTKYKNPNTINLKSF